MSTEDFIKKAIIRHGDKYDYSKTEYTSNKTKVCIICPEHGEFWQMPSEHLRGKGCKKCGISRSHTIMTTEEWVNKARKVHKDRYDYSKVIYTSAKTKVCIICPEHGEFWQTPNDHLCGKGCPVCRQSKMEAFVENILTESNLSFNRQKKFDWLGSQSLDFYLPYHNIAIECQGVQHYKPVSFGSKRCNSEEMLKLNKERDEKKKKLCESNGVKIIYFSTEVCAYNVLKNKDELLKEIEKYDI